MHAAGTLLDLGYGHDTAPGIHAISGFAVVCSEMALMDLAMRSTPRGCESLGFSLMMSARNGTTALVLLFVPLLPRVIMSTTDGDAAPGPATTAPPPTPAAWPRR